MYFKKTKPLASNFLMFKTVIYCLFFFWKNHDRNEQIKKT